MSAKSRLNTSRACESDRSTGKPLAKAWNPGTKVGQDREYYTIAAIMGARFCYTPGEFAVYNRWTRTSVSAAPADQRYEYQEKILHRC